MEFRTHVSGIFADPEYAAVALVISTFLYLRFPFPVRFWSAFVSTDPGISIVSRHDNGPIRIGILRLPTYFRGNLVPPRRTSVRPRYSYQ